MPSQGTLILHEYNDETIYVTLWADQSKTVPLDISGAVVQFIYKTSANQPDEEALVVTADIVDPLTGSCKVELTNQLISLSRQFFRIDVLSGTERKTAVYGPINVVNL